MELNGDELLLRLLVKCHLRRRVIWPLDLVQLRVHCPLLALYPAFRDGKPNCLHADVNASLSNWRCNQLLSALSSADIKAAGPPAYHPDRYMSTQRRAEGGRVANKLISPWGISNWNPGLQFIVIDDLRSFVLDSSHLIISSLSYRSTPCGWSTFFSNTTVIQ